MRSLNKKAWLATAIVLALSTTALAATSNMTLLDPQTVQWSNVKSMPGAQVTVLSGNPEKKEPFVVRIKLPANYAVAVHSHPINEFDTVISGTYLYGTGDVASRDKTIELPAGSFVSIPSHLKHYGWTKEETIIQINGIGPWRMIYS